MKTTETTRRESHERVDKKRRCHQILEILDEMGEATAKEIAVRMCEKGFTDNTERNNSSPRLTELESIGMVRIVGKKICPYTGRKVAVYKAV